MHEEDVNTKGAPGQEVEDVEDEDMETGSELMSHMETIDNLSTGKTIDHVEFTNEEDAAGTYEGSPIVYDPESGILSLDVSEITFEDIIDIGRQLVFRDALQHRDSGDEYDSTGYLERSLFTVKDYLDRALSAAVGFRAAEEAYLAALDDDADVEGEDEDEPSGFHPGDVNPNMTTTKTILGR